MSSTTSITSVTLSSSSSSTPSTTSAVSSSSSSSSPSRRSCAYFASTRPQPSTENIRYFACLGGENLARALLRHFPVLERLSVDPGMKFTAYITVKSINILIEKKQLIFLVKNFQLPSSLCQDSVVALVILSQNVTECRHLLKAEIGHILYFNPLQKHVDSAIIYSRALTANKMSDEVKAFCTVNSIKKAAVFGQRLSAGERFSCNMAENLLFNSINIKRDCAYCSVITAQISLAEAPLPGAQEHVPQPNNIESYDVAIFEAIEREVAQLPTMDTIAYLCPPADSALLAIEKEIVATTVLPQSIVSVVCNYLGCWEI